MQGSRAADSLFPTSFPASRASVCLGATTNSGIILRGWRQQTATLVSRL